MLATFTETLSEQSLLRRGDQLVAHVIRIDHLAAIDAADLNQHRRLKFEPALVIVLDTIAVFPRRELRSQPFARIQAIARVRHLDRVLARRIGDLKDFLGQQISALFSRARTCRKSPREIFVSL